KPSNIIFSHGQPKLADIGLIANQDATCSFVGTEGYLPPEGPGSPQADLYSLGKVLYEASTGHDRCWLRRELCQGYRDRLGASLGPQVADTLRCRQRNKWRLDWQSVRYPPA